MSALPSPAAHAAPTRPRAVRVPRAVVAAGRLAQVCALVLLVPGEAARIASDLDARPRG